VDKRRKILLGFAAGGVATIAIAGGLFWYLVLRDDAPPKVTLSSALDSIPASPTASTASTSSPQPSPGLPGTWVPDTSQQTFLGYRVNEQLVRIGVNTAVGRTSGVTGQLVIEGNTVKSATFEADLTKLASDSGLRDGQLRNQAIETNKFPKATFALSDPITLPDTLLSGQAFDTTLKGKLTLHGVTREVAIPAQAQMKSGLIVVVGSIEIQFSDYSISKPSGATVLSIEDHGTIELQLFLKKSS
jgi:polyisoprenoid-binding protein YceI